MSSMIEIGTEMENGNKVIGAQPVYDYEAEAAGDPEPEFLGFIYRVQLPDGRIFRSSNPAGCKG